MLSLIISGDGMSLTGSMTGQRYKLKSLLDTAWLQTMRLRLDENDINETLYPNLAMDGTVNGSFQESKTVAA